MLYVQTQLYNTNNHIHKDVNILMNVVAEKKIYKKVQT